MVKVLILFYSTYGHVAALAQAAYEAAKTVEGAEVTIKRVKETLPQEILEKIGAVESQKQLASKYPVMEDRRELANYDVIVFGFPTRLGAPAAQMKNFVDSLGLFVPNNGLVGKVATCFTSAANQHGGVEAALLSFHVSLLHLGFVITGLPYSFTGQCGIDEIKGCSPYGASTICGQNGERMPSKTELEGIAYQTIHAVKIGAKLAKKE